MKDLVPGVLILALAASSSAVLAAVEVSIPTLLPPGIVDGDLADPCWAKAFKTPAFTAAKSGEKLTEATYAYAFCDESALYVAYRCEFTDLAAREKVVADSKNAFSGDCVETFIDAGDTGAYAHFAVNVGGSVSKLGFCGDVKAAVQLHEKAWTVEIEIPYSSLKLSGQNFSKNWRMNFCRGNYGIKETSSWAKLNDGTFHDASAFNVVTGIPADLAQIAKEQALAARKDFDVRLDHVIYADAVEVKATLDMVGEKSLGGYAVRVRIVGQDGAALVERTVKPVYFHNEATLPIGELPDGRYSCEVALVRPDGTVEKSRSEDFWKVPPPKDDPARAQVEIRGQNIYVNGRFFFPVITWKCSATGDFKTREEWESVNDAFYADMAAHGINALIDTAVETPDLPPEWFEKVPRSMAAWHRKQYEIHRRLGVGLADFAQLAAKHGIYIIHLSRFLRKKNLQTSVARQCFVEEMLKYRDIPNILCWHTSDESDGEIDENLLRNRLYHEIDPCRLTWLNIINAVSANKDAADILATDPYPIPNGSVNTVAVHADRLKKNTEGRPLVASWLWLQNFGGELSWTRPPTPDEVQAMALLALNHGMSGIAYFNWTEPELRNGVRQNPESWSMLKDFNVYLQKWAEPMLTGKRLFLGKRGDEDVLEFEFGGKKYRSSVNIVTFTHKIEEIK